MLLRICLRVWGEGKGREEHGAEHVGWMDAEGGIGE